MKSGMKIIFPSKLKKALELLWLKMQYQGFYTSLFPWFHLCVDLFKELADNFLDFRHCVF